MLKFEDVIISCVEGENSYNSSQVTDIIYKVLFRDYSSEYKELLELKKKDGSPCSAYIKDLLSHLSKLENAVAYEIYKVAAGKGKLTLQEAENIVLEIAKNPLIEPYIAHVQGIVASRANAGLRYKV